MGAVPVMIQQKGADSSSHSSYPCLKKYMGGAYLLAFQFADSLLSHGQIALDNPCGNLFIAIPCGILD